MLPVRAPLLTMEHIQREASDQVLESLTTLAAECAEAGCRPLEVFTRSAECSARCDAVKATAHQLAGPKRASQQKRVRYTKTDSRYRRQSERALQELGAQQSMAALIMTFLHVFSHLVNKHDERHTRMLCSDMDQMLPGMLPCSVQHMEAVLAPLRPALNSLNEHCALHDVGLYQCLLCAIMLHELPAFHATWQCRVVLMPDSAR